MAAKTKVKANLRMQKTAKLVLESKGKKSVSKAMIEAGYPATTAKNPQQVTSSKGWKELMEKYLSDEFLAKKHKELLNKKEILHKFDHETGEWISEKTDEPETQAVSKGLDMAYKLKGAYAPDRQLVVSVEVEPSEEIKELAARLNAV